MSIWLEVTFVLNDLLSIDICLYRNINKFYTYNLNRVNYNQHCLFNKNVNSMKDYTNTQVESKELDNQSNKDTESKCNNASVSPFEIAVKNFINYTNSQYQAIPIISKTLNAHVKMRSKTLVNLIKDNNLQETVDENSGVRSISIPRHLVSDFSKNIKAVNISSLTAKIVKTNSVVAIVSQYDAFLSELIRIYYSVIPQAFEDSEKKFTIGQILQFGTIDEFKKHLVEKDVETILRSSHTDQIDWLSKKLDIPLTKNLDIYPDFVEITERRNLFVHANGKVCKQYIKVCTDFKVKGIDCVHIGQVLDCDNDYVNKCYAVFFEMGVKLGVVMWHKLKPEEAEALYSFYDPLCYNLIREKKYDLALNLLSFIQEPVFKKDCPYAYKLVFTINKALCFSLKGEKKKAFDIVTTLDCSATELIYRLAVCVIKEDYEQAIEYMKQMGDSKRFKEAYKEWPLFTFIRETDAFKSTFNSIFNEDYVYDEIADDEFNNLLDKALTVLTEVNEKTEDFEQKNEEP